jgi:hypothetical protein
MFTIEKKGEWLASVDFFETALQVARSYGKNTQVRRTRDGALCARVGRPIDFVADVAEAHYS